MSTKSILLLLLIISYSFTSPKYFISNPASINLSNQPKISIRYLTINTSIANNSLNFSSYNNNFNIDPDWDSIQKIQILNSIPDLGFTLSTDAFAAPVEFYSRLFNVSIYGRSNGSGNLPKDLFDIALFGNDLNRQYNLVGTQVNTINYAGCAIGSSYPVIKPTEDYDVSDIWSIKQLNVGARFHYQKGIFVTQTDSSFGFVFTTPNAFLAQAKLFQSTASGANCFAFDVGTTVELQQPLSVGLALLNINTGFNWTKNPKQMSYEIDVDSFSVQRYQNFNNIDSFITKTDTTIPISPFKTSIPVQLLLQTRYEPMKMLAISAYYHQYFKESQFIPDFNSRLDFDIYFSPVRFFSTGISLVTDFKNDFIIGHDFRFIIKGFTFNVFVNQRNGYLGSAKGLDLGLSFAQSWY
jgi:hypothetical protein